MYGYFGGLRAERASDAVLGRISGARLCEGWGLEADDVRPARTAFRRGPGRRPLPSPQLLLWNLLNSDMLTGRPQNPRLRSSFALDVDGVFCGNNPVGDDDPGYEAWLQNAPPLWLPRCVPASLIITYRCEKHRAATQEWLRRGVCKWERLVTAPYDEWRERDRNLSPVHFKARHLAESPCVGLTVPCSITSPRRMVLPLSGRHLPDESGY